MKFLTDIVGGVLMGLGYGLCSLGRITEVLTRSPVRRQPAGPETATPVAADYVADTFKIENN